MIENYSMEGRGKLRPGSSHADVVCAASITPCGIDWLWPQWLPKGKLTVLAGAGGAGKTTLAIALASCTTTGKDWPDGAPNQKPGRALIWSSEDDYADTLVPRLIAAGAVMNRVHVINGRINAGKAEPFDPATDLDLLRKSILNIGEVSLLILDPLVNAVRGDMHRANDVRRGLQPVVDFASEHNCAVLGITHFSKGSSASAPVDRVLGSQAFGAVSRIVLVAAKSSDSDIRVLARAKSNIGSDQGGINYTVETVTLEDLDITTSYVIWGDLIEGNAGEILAEVESPDSNRESDDDPVEALKRILRDGPVNGNAAKKLMIENGYSEKQTRRAREKLKIETIREGSGRSMTSTWSLP